MHDLPLHFGIKQFLQLSHRFVLIKWTDANESFGEAIHKPVEKEIVVLVSSAVKVIQWDSRRSQCIGCLHSFAVNSLIRVLPVHST